MAKEYYEDELLAKFEKADKIGNTVEMILDVIFGVGCCYTGGKIAEKLYEEIKPKSIPEIILMVLGVSAGEYAVMNGAFDYIHKCCHPYEETKKQELINQTLVMMKYSGELSVEALKLAKTSRKEADLLCKAIYESVEVPDVGVDLDDFTKDVDVPLDDEEDN